MTEETEGAKMTTRKPSELIEYGKNKELFEEIPKTEYEALKQDIQATGIKNPLIILPDNTVICGHQRRKAAIELGLELIPCRIVHLNTDDKIEEYVIKENLLRRHLTTEQRYMLYAHLSKLYEKGRGGDRKSDGFKDTQSVSLNLADDADVNEKTAKAVGVKSPTTIAKARKYARITKEYPELAGRKAGYVTRTYNQKKRKPQPLPKETFNVILADPPWRYDFSETTQRDIENQYPTMELKEITALKPPTAENAVLFLWATNPKLPQAMEVIKAWGFTYKTKMEWVKDKIGMGYWCRAQSEPLLIATKGTFSPPLPEKRKSCVINAPRTKHSEKPECIYEIIEQMFPKQKYLELFARTKRKGWQGWGLEYESRIA